MLYRRLLSGRNYFLHYTLFEYKDGSYQLIWWDDDYSTEPQEAWSMNVSTLLSLLVDLKKDSTRIQPKTLYLGSGVRERSYTKKLYFKLCQILQYISFERFIL